MHTLGEITCHVVGLLNFWKIEEFLQSKFVFMAASDSTLHVLYFNSLFIFSHSINNNSFSSFKGYSFYS